LQVGYALLGKNATLRIVQPQAPASTGTTGSHPKLTVEQMKQMADVQASELVEKSKTDPKNAPLLVQIAGMYQTTHQLKEAAHFDRALAQLNQALSYDPAKAHTLFNLGIVKWQGQKDRKSAVAAWQELLDSNPGYAERDKVRQLIAQTPSD
jgi:tetratricopeptide (TPR) repeat protein